MDTLPSRFVSELPNGSIQKNESNLINDDNDFDFNQDNTIDFDDEFRSPGWERLKKNKILKWKK